jgi:hypothetical protein
MMIIGFRKPTAVGTRTWFEVQIVNRLIKRNSFKVFCSRESKENDDISVQLRRNLLKRQKPKPIRASPAPAIADHTRKMLRAHRPGNQIADRDATARADALPVLTFGLALAKKGRAAIAINAQNQTAKRVLEFCRPRNRNSIQPNRAMATPWTTLFSILSANICASA